MNLPPEFISNIQNVFGEAGHTFLKALPDLMAEASSKWSLTEVQPAPALSYNFVAFAHSPLPEGEGCPEGKVRGEGNVVLKIGVPRDELASEIATLRLFNSEGACRLIDADEEKGFLLLERLRPGAMLAAMEDDEEATHIAAEVMKKIWRSGLDTAAVVELTQSVSRPRRLLAQRDNRSKFIKLSDWFDGLKKLRSMFNGGTGPLNEKLVERVERSVSDFFSENHVPVLMHGDFHHFNILSSERGWLVIDPKGVIGPAGYEVGPFLMNPWGDLLDRTNYRRITERRIDILHEHLGFERERIREWGLAHAVLSTWWGIEDNTGWEYSLAFAEMIASL